MTPPDRPQITPEIVGWFADYYRAEPAWGSLHVVLDDRNVEDHFVDGAIAYAVERKDRQGEFLARLLKTMSKSQRGRIGRRAEQQVRNP